MTKEEFGKLAMFLKAAYEKDKFLASKETMEVWDAVLKDIPYQLAQAAAVNHVRTCKFPPTPAEIIGHAVDATIPDQEPWSVEWEKVQKAIQSYGMWDETGALNSLDELTRTVVKRLGFGNLCMSQNVMTDRANFRTIYEQEQSRRRNKALTTEGFRELLEDSPFKMLE